MLQNDLPAPLPPPRIGQLNSLTAVRREMVKVYREARQGQLDRQDASRLVFMLTAIGRLIESSDLEQRLEKVEAQIESVSTSANRQN